MVIINQILRAGDLNTTQDSQHSKHVQGGNQSSATPDLCNALQGWNLRRLDSMLSRTLDKNKVQIPGVSTPFLYFGMWRSIFAW